MGRGKDDDRDEVLAEVSGGSVQVNPWGGFIWSQWGSARLMLTPTRVIERTKFFISERYTTAVLSQVTGVSIVTLPNPVLLVLGFATLIVFGLGLIFLLLALFWRHQLPCDPHTGRHSGDRLQGEHWRLRRFHARCSR